jgi:hypothetical protein
VKVPEFDWDPEPIVDFLGFELRESGKTWEVDLLKNAIPSLYSTDSDRFYTGVGLQLTVPLKWFRELKPKVDEVEQLFRELASPAFRAFDNFQLDRVFFAPLLQKDPSWKLGIEQPLQVTAEETSRIWKPGYLRLFLSHKSEIHRELGQIRPRLHLFGIDPFIAHVDIEPDRHWQSEIEHGLQTCEALAAFHSTGFRTSEWCMQEIGWAQGRGIHIQSLLVGETPAGFHSKKQGFPINLSKPFEAAETIAKALRKEERLVSRIFDGFERAFAEAPDGQTTWAIWGAFKELWPCPDTHKEKIATAFRGNPEAMKSYRAKPEFEKWAGDVVPVSNVTALTAPAPAEDEYDPFAE